MSLPVRNSLKIFIKNLVDSGKRKFIICPYGYIGQQVKHILNNEFDIREILLLDNNSEADNVFPISVLNSCAGREDTYCLLATLNASIYVELRQMLGDYLDNEHIWCSLCHW